jgi:hypothetical protein
MQSVSVRVKEIGRPAHVIQLSSQAGQKPSREGSSGRFRASRGLEQWPRAVQGQTTVGRRKAAIHQPR